MVISGVSWPGKQTVKQQSLLSNTFPYRESNQLTILYYSVLLNLNEFWQCFNHRRVECSISQSASITSLGEFYLGNVFSHILVSTNLLWGFHQSCFSLPPSLSVCLMVSLFSHELSSFSVNTQYIFSACVCVLATSSYKDISKAVRLGYRPHSWIHITLFPMRRLFILCKLIIG